MTYIASTQKPDLGPLTRITHLDGPDIDIFVGDKRAISDPALLAENGIKMVLNCAVNLDVDIVEAPDPSAEALPWGRGYVRYYKLGLVDGPGNPMPMILAGYYQLAGLIEQQFPDKPSYPMRERGNVLVNCRAGRSRSVTLVGLYLHLQMPERFPTLAEAIDFVAAKRGLAENIRHKTPKPVLIGAAEWAAEMVKMIRPHMVAQ